MLPLSVATSAHTPTEAVHDRITRTAGSFSRTIENLRKLVANGIPARVAMVAMAENASLADSTVTFLKDEVGVKWITRAFRPRVRR
ncbi:MAG TPA: hypothetical protein VN670_00085 [Acidobacteriaceae bacterium]|nr:hypothetical protein [Acidobacteriaceae bacterium]